MPMDKDYQAEYDLDTVIAAEQIKNDSSRMNKAKAVAKERAEKAQEISDSLTTEENPLSKGFTKIG